MIDSKTVILPEFLANLEPGVKTGTVVLEDGDYVVIEFGKDGKARLPKSAFPVQTAEDLE